jgi:hypothetical protein
VLEHHYRGGPLLLEAINSLRQASEQHHMAESELLDLQLVLDSNPIQGLKTPPDANIKLHLQKHLPLFNKARRAINKQPEAALSLLQKIAKQMQKLTGNAPIAELFWLFSAIVNAFQRGDLALTDQRKQWLLLIEKHMTVLYKQPEQMLSRPISKSVKREFLGLLALSGSDDDLVQKLLKVYKVPGLLFSDREITQALSNMNSPSRETYEQLYFALSQSIEIIRPQLELLMDGQVLEEEGALLIKGAMQEMVGAVTLCEMQKTTQLIVMCQQLLDKVIIEPDVDTIEALSSQLLYMLERFKILANSDMLEESQQKLMSLDDATILHHSIFNEARQAVNQQCDDILAQAEIQLESQLLSDTLANQEFLTLIHILKSSIHLLQFSEAEDACDTLSEAIKQKNSPSIAENWIRLRNIITNWMPEYLH